MPPLPSSAISFFQCSLPASAAADVVNAVRHLAGVIVGAADVGAAIVEATVAARRQGTAQGQHCVAHGTQREGIAKFPGGAGLHFLDLRLAQVVRRGLAGPGDGVASMTSMDFRRAGSLEAPWRSLLPSGIWLWGSAPVRNAGSMERPGPNLTPAAVIGAPFSKNMPSLRAYVRSVASAQEVPVSAARPEQLHGCRRLLSGRAH